MPIYEMSRKYRGNTYVVKFKMALKGQKKRVHALQVSAEALDVQCEVIREQPRWSRDVRYWDNTWSGPA